MVEGVPAEKLKDEVEREESQEDEVKVNKTFD